MSTPGQETTKPSQAAVVTDLVGALQHLRDHDGISHAKLLKARPILELDVVAAESAGPEDEHLAAAAYNVIHCVLTVGAFSVSGDVKQLLAWELNLDGSLAPAFEKRQTEIVARLSLWGQDYKKKSRSAYERLASTLTLMRRSPCSEGIEAAELAALRKKHRDEARDGTAELFNLGWERLLQAHSRAEAAKVARQLFEKLPGLMDALQELTGSRFFDPLDALRLVLDAVRPLFDRFARTFVKTHPAPPGGPVSADFLFKLLYSAGQYRTNDSPELHWSLQALSALMKRLEDDGSWINILNFSATVGEEAVAEAEAADAVAEAVAEIEQEDFE